MGYCRNADTVEKAPRMEHYRNLDSIANACESRPTLQELQMGLSGGKANDIILEDDDTVGNHGN